MIRLDLNPEEVSLLRELLDTAVTDLKVEISATDLLDYRERLRSRKSVLLKVLWALDEEAA